MTLNAENHHWQWVAFLSGGSTALYVLIYSWYFFAFDTEVGPHASNDFCLFGYVSALVFKQLIIMIRTCLIIDLLFINRCTDFYNQ